MRSAPESHSGTAWRMVRRPLGAVSSKGVASSASAITEESNSTVTRMRPTMPDSAMLMRLFIFSTWPFLPECTSSVRARWPVPVATTAGTGCPTQKAIRWLVPLMSDSTKLDSRPSHSRECGLDVDDRTTPCEKPNKSSRSPRFRLSSSSRRPSAWSKAHW